MRSVRSLRVLLAFGVGLMAITAGLAQQDTTTTPDATGVTTTESTEGSVPAPEPVDTTVKTETTMTPEEAAGEPPKPEETDPLTAEDLLKAATDGVSTATSGSDNTIVDTAGAVTDALKDPKEDTPIIDASSGIVETVKNADLASTQELPSLPADGSAAPAEAVNTVADTIADTAGAAPQIGSGALAQQFSGSDNSAVATGAQIAGQILQSGIIDPKNVQSLASTAQDPQVATTLSALKNGAEIASGLSACSASVQGNEAEISSSLTALGTSMINSDSIAAAAAMGNSLIKAWSVASGESADPMYQLFRIYLDQQGNAGKALNSAQTKAYSQLTPQCNGAFDDIVETWNDSRGTVNSLMAGGNKNVTCSNYKNEDTKVDMTLCVWPSAVWTKEEKIMANISATFTNYGAQLCDVSFYVINLDKAIAKSPAWLPDANTAFPNGIETGKEVAIEASVPWTQEIAQNKPIVDILKGWSACPNGRVTPAPTTKPTARATEAPKTSDTDKCFLTDKCKAAIAPYANDQCAQYTQLLTSKCSTCDNTVLAAAHASCIKSCGPTYCGEAPIADKEQTSAAGAVSRAFAFVATLAAGVAAVLAF